MVKRIMVKCEYCNIDREINSTNKSKLCQSCSQKNRFGTLGINKWYKVCKGCGDTREFSWRKTYQKSGDLCVSCSQIKNDEVYNREYKKYRGKVWTETNRQKLYMLENYEKRGKSGIPNAYQLDHIIPIKYGYDNNIPPDKIGSIDNLQFIPWEENRNKSNKYKK
jgi:hypothetical protein